MAVSKKTVYQVKGMSKDASVSKFNQELAYNIKNMRILATDNETSFSLVNERGTTILDRIYGTPIGQAVVDNKLIIFSTTEEGSTPDYITEYKDDPNDYFEGQILYNGNLNFSKLAPIETLVVFEGSNIEKIYWTDGVNQPRVINVAATPEQRDNWVDTSFDFSRKLQLKEVVTITKNTVTTGVFAPGSIQYCFTYHNIHEGESNIFYTSPLYYTSYENRGGSPEDTVSNSFIIQIDNLDSNFDFIRIYSILRTSIDSTAQVKMIADISVPKATDLNPNPSLIYVDNGTTGESIDPTQLLYIGGDNISFGTMNQKDNVLFLGDIKYNREELSVDIKNFFRGKTPLFNSTDKILPTTLPSGKNYFADSQLKYNSENIKTFKYNEYYRFGIQAQYENGKWSKPIYLSDVQNSSAYSYIQVGAIPIMHLVSAKYTLNDADIISEFERLHYVKIRPVIVYPEFEDRECVCQGVLAPTVYNVNDRFSNIPFSQSSWFFRPNGAFDYNRARGKLSYKVTPSGGTTLSDIAINSTYTNSGRTFKVISKITGEGVVVMQDVTSGDSEASYQDRYLPSSRGLMTAVGSYSSFQYSSCVQFIDLSLSNWTDLNTPLINLTSQNSKFGAYCNYPTVTFNEGQANEFTFDFSNFGKWAEFRHNYPIPANIEYNSEVQSIYNQARTPYTVWNKSSGPAAQWVANNRGNFYIDQSIVTLHSPDIEFDPILKKLDDTPLKLRIIGAIPIHASISDIDIISSTLPNHFCDTGATLEGNRYYFDEVAMGFYKERIASEYPSIHGWKNMLSGAFWIDDISKYKQGQGNPNKLSTGFVVYPWERSGQLNNGNAECKFGYKTGLLQYKKMSVLRYSYDSVILPSNKIWHAWELNDTTKTGISGVTVFDSNEQSSIRIPSPKNSGLSDLIYYGNVDKVSSSIDEYPIVVTERDSANNEAHKLFAGDYHKLTTTHTDTNTSLDPVSIKYKSTPHIVLALNYTSNGTKQRVLPTSQDNYNPHGLDSANDANTTPIGEGGFPQFAFWDNNQICEGVSQDVIQWFSPKYGYLWLGELYNDSVINRFGGDSEEALESNLWIPCGEPVSIYNNDNELKDSLDIVWSEGDTYYQRYDCLKTYPFTMEDQNSIVDILSFMCETRINIDGRYDRNRGKTSNLVMSPQNFNLMNLAYSQKNNMFNYRVENPNKDNLREFPNLVTWTKTKTLGEEIDTWTNITLASTLPLDGDKGKVRAIRRFNNNLFAFQDKGISNILYNENVQIASTAGVPIEIANSAKVQGKRYLSNNVGCVNKWSICETTRGLYFLDSLTKDIYVLGGEGIVNLSDRLGFHSWVINNLSNLEPWNPSTFSNCVSYYDKINNEVLFITEDECLAYNENAGQFTSFYSYEGSPYVTFVKDTPIIIHWGTVEDVECYALHKLWAGEYNEFFGHYKPFSVSIIANPYPTDDKIFNTVEFRSDSWSKAGQFLQDTFDTLTVENEYQLGESTLTFLPSYRDIPSALKQKFRIWRANVPRNNNSRDRIRNPWAKITLSKESTNYYKTILHDIAINYFI